MRNERGSTFITTAVLIAFAAVISTYALLYSSQSFKTKSEKIKALERKEKTLENTFKKFIKHEPETISSLDCFRDGKELCLRSNRRFSDISNQSEVTGILLDNPLKFPLFDMEQIFSKISPCPKRVENKGVTSFNGTSLTEQSSLSKNDCLYINPAAYEEIILEDNIFSDFEISFSGGKLASAGYIQTLGTFRIEKDFLIIAAGDINLNKVIVPNSTHLTLVSTTGFVSIKTLEGTPKLKTIAKNGSFIGGLSVPQDSPQDLPYLQNLILSYRD